MKRIFLRVRNLLGGGCKGDIISLTSASGELTMHICSECGDWYIDVREQQVGKGKWIELESEAPVIASYLRSQGYVTAADELLVLASTKFEDEEVA